MDHRASLTRVVFKWVDMTLCVLKDRFTIRKDRPLISVPLDEKVDFFWRIITICLWMFCIYMRSYDAIIRGCSPIALETLIPLLRVAFLENEAIKKKEEVITITHLGNNIHRSQNVINTSLRNGPVQPRRKERVGFQTAFAVEQIAWFFFVLITMDLTIINRLSVALFFVNTLHWIRFGLKSTACLVVLYLLGTCFWCPAYSLRSDLLTLSGQRLWIYNFYSSYSLAFSITLLVTETQFLQRARYKIIQQIIMLPKHLEKSLSKTPLQCICTLVRWLLDCFFFVGFNFGMALCMWFSSMMFEWALEVSVTGFISTIFIIILIAIPGEGWMMDFKKAFQETVLCLLVYIIVAMFVFCTLPTHTLSFTANAVSSAFFVFYIAANSPRRVHSALPLALVWLGMVGVNLYWHINRSGVNSPHISWYNKLFCVNTISVGGLFMVLTAIHVYRWEWPMNSSTVGLVVRINIGAKTTPPLKNEQKSKEKCICISSIQSNTEKLATTTITTITVKKSTGGVEDKIALSPSLLSTSSSLSITKGVGFGNLTTNLGTETTVAQCDQRDEMSEESICKSSCGPSEKQVPVLSDVNVVEEELKQKSFSEPPTNICTPDKTNNDVKKMSEENVLKVELLTNNEIPDKPLTKSSALEVASFTLSPREKKKEEQEQVLETTSSTASLSGSRNRKEEEEGALLPLVSFEESPRTELSLQITAPLHSPPQTDSGSSSDRDKSSSAKIKETPRNNITLEGNFNKKVKTNDHVAVAAADKTQRPAKNPSVRLPEKVAQGTSLQSLKERTPLVSNDSTAGNKQSQTAPSSSVHHSVTSAVINTSKEHPAKQPGRKEPAVAYANQLPSQPSAMKAVSTEPMEAKCSTMGKKATTRVNPTTTTTTTTTKCKLQVPMLRSSKTPVCGLPAAETTVTAGATTTNATTRTTTGLMAATRLESSEVNVKRHSGDTEIRQDVSVKNLPQRFSKMVLTSSSPSAPTSAVMNEPMGGMTSLTINAIKDSDVQKETFLASTDKHPLELSSCCDDDVSLDFGHLHLGSPHKVGSTSPLQQTQTTTSESPRAVPSSVRDALENFAKAWMTRSGRPDTSEGERCETEAEKVDTPVKLGIQSSPSPATSRTSLSRNISPGTVNTDANNFSETRGSAQPCVLPQVYQTGNGFDRPNTTGYQQATTGLQQQVPVMLVSLGDGRLAYCPLVTVAYPTASHVLMQSAAGKPTVVQHQHPQLQQHQQLQHPQLQQQHQQQQQMQLQQTPMVYPQVSYASQQVYSEGWMHMAQHMNTQK